MVSPGVPSVHVEADGVCGAEPHPVAAGLAVVLELYLVQAVVLLSAGGAAPVASFSP